MYGQVPILDERRKYQFVGFCIKYFNRTKIMVHLDALSLTYKECLMNGIGSIGTIAPVGMPAGVGSGCLRAVGLCVIPRLFTVALYQRSNDN